MKKEPNPTKLKAFANVLGRNDSTQPWRADIYLHQADDGKSYQCACRVYKMCIPYLLNRKLENTNEDCPEIYKIWREKV